MQGIQVQAVHVWGVNLVGLTTSTAIKLGYSVGFLAVLIALRYLARAIVRGLLRGRENVSARFWSRQAINLATAILVVLGFVSIWFDNPAKLATGAGLVTAGLAFALQKAVTSVAGYFLILRGDMFSVGDRIVMGGVRGDVIRLGFLRTTILEMGQPAGDTDAGAEMWVSARQHTGRIVTVTNGVVFDDPVYNYSREFPYLWEEMRLPIPYAADRRTAESILVDVADRHTADTQALGAESIDRMRRRYFVPDATLEPSTYFRLTDNWLEIAVRFVAPSQGIRELKSNMSRDILDAFEKNGIEIASATYDIVGLPPVRLQTEPGSNGSKRSDEDRSAPASAG